MSGLCSTMSGVLAGRTFKLKVIQQLGLKSSWGHLHSHVSIHMSGGWCYYWLEPQLGCSPEIIRVCDVFM